MSNSNSPEQVVDDLDAFSEELFGTKKSQQQQHQEEKELPVDKEEGVDEDTQTSEDDTLAPEADEDLSKEDLEQVPEEKPKSRFQKRIDELVTKVRETEEAASLREAKLRSDMETLIAKLNSENKPDKAVEPRSLQNISTDSAAPDPSAKDANGEDKYPLGEFDLAYIRDYTRYTLTKELEAQKAAEAEEQARQSELASKNALIDEWAGKLEAAKEKYPDLVEKNYVLQDSFQDIDPRYGEYLASTIMSLEYGPDVLYYLASNVDEAKKIADSGPARATIALGRLEARFAFQDQEKGEKKLKVSKAPSPPERLNKGNMVSKEIADDTDDLDAFAQKLFSKRRR